VTGLLSGCAETVYRTKLEIYCPPLQQYTPEFNEELATQIEALPEASAIPMVVSDYAKLRDRIRDCQKERDKHGD